MERIDEEAGVRLCGRCYGIFGMNGHVKKVFWTLLVSMAGLVLARVLDPVTAQQVVGVITAGMGL